MIRKTRFLLIVFLFIFGSIIGWLLEVVYRRFISSSNPSRKWKNPGLLSGPWLPIYGFGVIFLYFASSLENILNVSTHIYVIILFIGSAIIMSLMELVGGSFLYNFLHMRLWDYRDEKFNYKGYTCPKFFLIWGSVSVGYYYLISKPIVRLVDRYLSNVDIFSYFVGVLWGFLLVDFWNSMGISIKIAKYAKKHNIIIDFEKVKDEARVKEKQYSNSKSEKMFVMPTKDNVISFIETSLKKAQDIVEIKVVEHVKEEVKEIVEELRNKD